MVTALEFRLFPIREVYAGVLFWPIDAAADVLHAWREWVPTVPEEVTSVGQLLRFPPLPELPDHLRGHSFAVVEAACLSYDEQAAAELLAPLHALRPEMDTFRPTPIPELGTLHMDPEGPVPAFGDGMLVGALPAAGITPSSRRSDPGQTRRCSRRSCASSAALSGQAPRRTGRSRRWTPRSRCSASVSHPTP